MTRLRASDIAAIARELYVDGSSLGRRLQHWRPYICPFEDLVEFVPRGARVLDISCGSGLFLALLATFRGVTKGIGFDANPDAISLAGAMANRLPEGTAIEFRHQKIEDPWPDGKFDLVSIIDVMHHVAPAHRRSLIRLAAARVMPGGILLYKDMAERPLWQATANRLHDLVIARDWIHYAPIAHIADWLGEEGFTETHARRIDRFWYGHELTVFAKPAPGN